MSFLLDTNICSAFLKGNRQVEGRVLLHGGGLYINTIILGELLTWTMRSNAPPSRQVVLDELLQEVTILDVTSDVARKYGEMQAALFDRGTPVPGMDLMIAATAIVHNLTLVTHNSQDFVNVPNLRMVDWLTP